MSEWLKFPDAPGWWEVDSPEIDCRGGTRVHEILGKPLILLLPEWVVTKCMMDQNLVPISVDHEVLRDWFWKRIETPDTCPEFDVKDDPK